MRVLTSWKIDAPVLIVLVLLAAAYLFGVRVLHRRGESWPVHRTVLFLGPGLGGIAVVTMSFLGVYDRTLFWPAAAQLTILHVLTPLLLALGEPVRLVARCLPGRRLAGGGMLKVLGFPMVSGILGLVVTMVVFFSPLFRISLTNEPVHQLVRLLMLAVGCLFVWPMLSEHWLPDWCGYPLRMAFAFVDGLIDAVPGIVVMTAHGLIAGTYYRGLHRTWGPSLHWDQTIGGGLMLTLSEAIAVPFAVALFLRWARSDEDEARRVDRRIATGAGPTAIATGAGPTAIATGAASAAEEPLLQRPWWETDPGPLADRLPLKPTDPSP